MKATAVYPLSALHGSITPDHYCRILKGKLIVQRKPKRDKAPTERQLAARREFAERQKQRRDGGGKVASGIVVVT